MAPKHEATQNQPHTTKLKMIFPYQNQSGGLLEENKKNNVFVV